MHAYVHTRYSTHRVVRGLLAHHAEPPIAATDAFASVLQVAGADVAEEDVVAEEVGKKKGSSNKRRHAGLDSDEESVSAGALGRVIAACVVCADVGARHTLTSYAVNDVVGEP